VSEENKYRGSCFCGTVQIKVTGEPVAAGYCHCESCRQWSAAPVNAFTLWPPQAVEVTSGAEFVEGFNKTPNSTRNWCTKCGGHLFTEHPGMGIVDVYAAIIPNLPFQAGLHVNYQETVLHIHDDLLKFKDYPQKMGGSGEAIAE
jgi:hypothetical protein